MSNRSRFGPRPLRTEEDSLIRALVGYVDGSKNLLAQVHCAPVHDKGDGGMGSLRFAGNERRPLGTCLLDAG